MELNIDAGIPMRKVQRVRFNKALKMIGKWRPLQKEPVTPDDQPADA